MDVLNLIGIILAASLLESLLSVLFGRRSKPETDVDLGQELEGRYTRLGSEYEDVGA